MDDNEDKLEFNRNIGYIFVIYLEKSVRQVSVDDDDLLVVNDRREIGHRVNLTADILVISCFKFIRLGVLREFADVPCEEAVDANADNALIRRDKATDVGLDGLCLLELLGLVVPNVVTLERRVCEIVHVGERVSDEVGDGLGVDLCGDATVLNACECEVAVARIGRNNVRTAENAGFYELAGRVLLQLLGDRKLYLFNTSH